MSAVHEVTGMRAGDAAVPEAAIVEELLRSIGVRDVLDAIRSWIDGVHCGHSEWIHHTLLPAIPAFLTSIHSWNAPQPPGHDSHESGFAARRLWEALNECVHAIWCFSGDVHWDCPHAPSLSKTMVGWTRYGGGLRETALSGNTARPGLHGRCR